MWAKDERGATSSRTYFNVLADHVRQCQSRQRRIRSLLLRYHTITSCTHGAFQKHLSALIFITVPRLGLRWREASAWMLIHGLQWNTFQRLTAATSKLFEHSWSGTWRRGLRSTPILKWGQIHLPWVPYLTPFLCAVDSVSVCYKLTELLRTFIGVLAPHSCLVHTNPKKLPVGVRGIAISRNKCQMSS